MTIPGPPPHTSSAAYTVDAGSRVRWSAVFAGLLIAMVTQLFLTLIGAAIGLAAWDPSSGKGLGIGAVIWAILSMLLSLFLGGAVAGWASDATARQSTRLHGALVWSLSTLMTTWLVASGVGAIAGSAFRITGNMLGAVAGAATEQAQHVVADVMQDGDGSMSSVRAEIETLLRQTGNPALRPESLSANAQRAEQMATQSSASNQNVANEIMGMISNTASTINRDDVINVIMARTGKSRAEAEQIADRAIALQQSAAAKLDTFKQQAAQSAESVASATSTGIWFTLIGMVLSLGAAIFGAVWATGRQTGRQRAAA